MNKIYRIIWSKAKHCYIVTSELAKRHAKGIGTRSFRLKAVTLAVAAALIGGIFSPVAHADEGLAVYAGDNLAAYADENEYMDGAGYTDEDEKEDGYVDGDEEEDEYADGDEEEDGYADGDEEEDGYADGDEDNGTEVTCDASDPTGSAGPAGSIVLLSREKQLYGINPESDCTELVITGEKSSTDFASSRSFAAAYSDTDEVNGYTVTVTGGMINGVYGGFSNEADVSDNCVTVEGGTVFGAYGGYTGNFGNAGNNVVDITGGTVSYVHGGLVYDGEASFNEVYISSSAAVNNNVYGGRAESNGNVSDNVVLICGNARVGGSGSSVYGGDANRGDADNNLVIVEESAKVMGAVYGGSSVSGAAGDNIVTISGGIVSNSVHGGFSETGDVYNNSVTVNGESTEVKGVIYGGLSNNSDVDANSVTIEEGTVGTVYGAFSSADSSGGSGNVNNNSVEISGGTVNGDVTGARTWSGGACENVVTVTGGIVNGEAESDINGVLGGCSDSGNAKENSVYVSGGTVNCNIYGGYSERNAAGNKVFLEGAAVVKGNVYGGFSGGGKVGGNEVTVNGGAVDGMLYGGYSDIKAVNGNKVTVIGGKLHSVYGGQAGNGIVSGNKVEITGGVLENVYGGYSGSNSQRTENNEVTVTGGTMHNVYGGYAEGDGAASDNTVNIGGGEVKFNVYGSYYADGKGTDNTVNFSGGTVEGTIYGSHNGKDNASSGNTLNIRGNALAAGGIKNFETVNVTKEVKWDASKAALSAKSFENYGKLDVSKVDFSNGDTGTMTLLASEAENDFGKLDVTYSGGNAVLNHENLSQVVKDNEEVESEEGGVKLNYTSGIHTISLDKGNSYKNVLYTVKGKNKIHSVSLGEFTFEEGGTARNAGGKGNDYTEITAETVNADRFSMVFDNPETAAVNGTMTLLKANKTLALDAKELKATTSKYSCMPVPGVEVEGTVAGVISAASGSVNYTVTKNQASKLTFGDVEWKDNGALMARPSNITFTGADVDTSCINFNNIKELEANKQMTLVSDFGDSVGTITGSRFTVGTGLEGEGSASLSGSDLIFTAETGVEYTGIVSWATTGLDYKILPGSVKKPFLKVQKQTHKTVMAMEAGMALLASGNDYVGKVIEGLADPANQGSDGASTFAAVGGSASRYETGSHVNTHGWNATVGVGSNRELKKGSFEWGVFGEYGKGNYSLHSDAGRGDGDAHYAGGGMLVKWTGKNDIYTEASFRLGRMKDSASNLLYDGAGKGYGYDVHANYYGAHIGAGKILRYKDGKSMDLYGKYIYTKRNGVGYNAGARYSIDSVASSVLRVGARYGTTDNKWNWYGGLAYEYEFDGKATGTVEGRPIRSASMQGGSVRGELGVRMNTSKKNPWQADISLYGYGGKHRGLGGNVSVTYFF